MKYFAAATAIISSVAILLLSQNMDSRNIDMIIIFGGFGLTGCLLIVGLCAGYALLNKMNAAPRRRRRPLKQVEVAAANQIEVDAEVTATPSNIVRIPNLSEWH